MLHVTNGDCAASQLRQARLPGEVIAWQDVLHEGPVPAALAFDELRRVRARFIADQGWASFDAVLADFERRDATLARSLEQDEVVLWFEHDLYDQLQLLQVLDWFAGQDLAATRLSLAPIDPFSSLGQLSPKRLRSLFAHRRPVATAQRALGREVWDAFRLPEPTRLQELGRRDTSALPFLGGAIRRHLEQFPATRDGLSRTERQIMEAVAGGAKTPIEVFRLDQTREQAPFMGDVTFWTKIRGLAGGTTPLLALSDPSATVVDAKFRRQTVSLTHRGQAVLAGKADRLDPDGIDRWLGGVHLRGSAPGWRWDGQSVVHA